MAIEDRCATCGVVIEVGDWPYCPHGRAGFSTIPDDWPGGKTFENLGHEPVTLYSKSELRHELAARGLQPFVRHVPAPEGHRPQTIDWAASGPAPGHDPKPTYLGGKPNWRPEFA